MPTHCGKVGRGQAILTVFGWIQAWFKRLNDESGYASTNVLLENPHSVQKVMHKMRIVTFHFMVWLLAQHI